MDNQGPEVTFLFQFGLIRDAVTVPQGSLNLKTIKNLAVSFLNSKVILIFFIYPKTNVCPLQSTINTFIGLFYSYILFSSLN